MSSSKTKQENIDPLAGIRVASLTREKIAKLTPEQKQALKKRADEAHYATLHGLPNKTGIKVRVEWGFMSPERREALLGMRPKKDFSPKSRRKGKK